MLRSLCFIVTAVSLGIACSSGDDSLLKGGNNCTGQSLGDVTFNTAAWMQGTDHVIKLKEADVGKLKPLPVKNAISSYRSNLSEGYSLCTYDEEDGMTRGYRIGSRDPNKYNYAAQDNKKADQYLLVKGLVCPSNPSASNPGLSSASLCQPVDRSSNTSISRKLGYNTKPAANNANYRVENHGQIQVRDGKYQWQDVGIGKTYPVCSLGQPMTACDLNKRAWGFENSEPCRNEVRDAECQ